MANSSYDLPNSPISLAKIFSTHDTVWRETLAVGKFGEFTAESYWRNKIWSICNVAS